MSENQKIGIIRGDTRYPRDTEVEILNHCQTTNEYLVKPVEGQTQCWVKPENLIVIYPKEVVTKNKKNIWDICAECRESFNRWVTTHRQKAKGDTK